MSPAISETIRAQPDALPTFTPLPILTTGLIAFGAIERTEAASHYIAKIIRPFDLVGSVELRHNLKGLPMVLEVLIPT